jgi:eukaryotic-like serine/threonine-protein kinase
MKKEAASYRERFEILEEIGEGGFAKVFRAKEVATGRKVAVKVLKDAYLRDAEIVERFRREVFAVASIESPHVVGMYDFGISGEEIYIAMEYVEGPTLRDLIYERSWTAAEVHLIVGQIAQALASAHRQEIVHRDLKPENVMLVPGPGGTRTVKVLDFGLAKLAQLERKLELEPLTRAGMCFGTPQYMAPELIQGKPFDKSIDLYALGVIAFEMMAGFLPWDGSDPRQILLSVVKNPPPHLTNAHPSIDRLTEVDAFLQGVLSKNKSQRPADAASFFRDLEKALFGDKRPRATAAKVPPDDAAFATVWAVALDLRAAPGDDATMVDARVGRFATPIENPAAPGTTSQIGPGSRSAANRRKLQSSWIPSLKDIDVVDDDSAITAPKVRKLPTLAPPKKPSEPKPGLRTDQTEMIKDPGARRRSLMWWLVPLLIGLVVFASALGYFLGRQSLR